MSNPKPTKTRALHTYITRWLDDMDVTDVQCLLIEAPGAGEHITLTAAHTTAITTLLLDDMNRWQIDSAPDEYRDTVVLPGLTIREAYRLAQGVALTLTR